MLKCKIIQWIRHAPYLDTDIYLVINKHTEYLFRIRIVIPTIFNIEYVHPSLG